MKLDITLELKSGGTVRFLAEWEPVDTTLAECSFILDVLGEFYGHAAVALGAEAPKPRPAVTTGKGTG